MGRRPSAVLAAALLVGVAVASGPPAAADRATGWATWTELAGSARDFTTTMQLPGLGFPAATVRSDSRAGGVGVQSGASAFLNAASPPGQVFGSSEGRPYLNLRPRSDSLTGSSTTTYTFDAPTPSAGWAMVLGDVDADQVQVTARLADGTRADAGDLGYAGSFNACDVGTPRTAGCGASVGDAPAWDAATQTLTGDTVTATTGAFADTVGATGWFRPTAQLSSLTLTYTRREGAPVFQTWFAAETRGLSGTVEVPAGGRPCTQAPTSVRLLTADDTEVATAVVDDDGSYAFDGLALREDYRAVVDPPATCAVVGPREQVVSAVVAADADDAVVAPFGVREIVPAPVSGTVRDTGGAGIGGVAVTLDRPDGSTATTTTADDGTYLFDDNPAAAGYAVSIDVPAGYTGDGTRDPFDVLVPPAGQEPAPVTGQDFVLTALVAAPGTPPGTDPTTPPTTAPTTPPTSPPAVGEGTDDEPGAGEAGADGPTDEADAPAGGTSPSGLLPDTGGPSPAPLALGAVLALSGAAVLLADARRRRARLTAGRRIPR